MTFATAKDGTRLHYEEAGSGTPVIFIHEFAGDHRSWEPQMRFFARMRIPLLRPLVCEMK